MSTVCMSDYCINQIFFFFFFSSGKIIYEKKGKWRTMQGAGKQKTGTGGAEPLSFFFPLQCRFLSIKHSSVARSSAGELTCL